MRRRCCEAPLLRGDAAARRSFVTQRAGTREENGRAFEEVCGVTFEELVGIGAWCASCVVNMTSLPTASAALCCLHKERRR